MTQHKQHGIKAVLSKDTTKPTKKAGQALEIDDGSKKWQGQEVGVNSNVPLVDSGTGKPYIIRQFEFSFDPVKLKEIRDKKIPIPSKQDLFNSVWNQIKITLWGDGLVAIEDPLTPPRVITYKKHFKIIVLCEAKFGVMIAERPSTLQEITKPT